MKTRYIAPIILTAVLLLALPSNAAAQSSVVRLKVVNVPVDSGLLAQLLPDFERTTGYRVEVDKRGDDLYDAARQGTADLTISHYGHVGVESFMADGLGLWPRAVFSNQAVLIGPATDPAGIRGIEDAVEAFRRIAASRSKFLVNNAGTEKYLAQVLWEASGRPDRGDWFVDQGLRDQASVQTAGNMGAYILWGIVPFLKFKETTPSSLQALVTDDPLFQRVMVSIVINPDKLSGINAPGAMALQKYLSAPSTQAQIRAFRYPGLDRQLFWPAARDNSSSFLSAATQPAVTGMSFNPASVRAGGSMTVTFAGTNIFPHTYLDVRFRAPGGTADEVAMNWQQGASGVHNVALGTTAGTWTVTGIRAHVGADDHSAPFVSVSIGLAVLP